MNGQRSIHISIVGSQLVDKKLVVAKYCYSYSPDSFAVVFCANTAPAHVYKESLTIKYVANTNNVYDGPGRR